MIKKIDNFLPKNLIDEATNILSGVGMLYGWKSNINAAYDNGHWNMTISKQPDKFSRIDMSRHDPIFKESPFREIWGHIQEIIGPRNLIRCYCNGYTYGTDSYAHLDEHELYSDYPYQLKTSETILIYLNDKWHYDYGGETVFYDDSGEISHSILPKYNRGVIFDSTILHSARSVTKVFGGLRKVLVFKTSEYSDDGLENKFEYLFSRTKDIPHSNGKLITHLMGVREILIDAGFPELSDVGLFHSVLGTSSYKNFIMSESELKRYVSPKDFDLIKEFSQTNYRLDSFTQNKRKELMIVDWANHLEQARRMPEQFQCTSSEYADRLEKLFNIKVRKYG